MQYTLLAKTYFMANVIHLVFMIVVVYIVFKMTRELLSKPHHVETQIINKKYSSRSRSLGRGYVGCVAVQIIIVKMDNGKIDEYFITDPLFDKVEIGKRYNLLIKGRDVMELTPMKELVQ